MNATASDQRERLPQFRAEARTARPARTAHPPAGREPPAPPADGLPMTPRFLTETWRGETRILFSIRAFYKCRRVAKSMPNRTLRPAGRPCGRERGFARYGGLCAWRVIARWLYRPFPAGWEYAPGRQFRQATNGSGSFSSARQREPGAAPSPPSPPSPLIRRSGREKIAVFL